MEPRNWLLASCAGAVGLIAGFFLADLVRHDGGTNPSATAGVPSSLPRLPSPGTVSGQTLITLEDVRRVVKEELIAREHVRAGASTESSAPTVADEPPGEAAQAATNRAREVLAAAIGRRQWTQADADALRSHFHLMPGDDQSELLRQFSQAINQGRLVPETDRVPF